jgi:enoyl-CoA hydratase
MEYQNILVEKEGATAVLSINRPKALNALNADVITELYDIWDELEKDDNIRAVIITGGGDKAFVAGADIGELAELNSLGGIELAKRGHSLLWKIENSDLIVIAAVNGFALGGGCELAMACDIRLASENAKIGQPEVNLGIIPGYGGTQRLTRLVGKGMAKYLIFSGEMVDAAEALRIGLVEKVYPQDELLIEAKKLAGKILSKGPRAVEAAKRCANMASNSDLDAGLKFEIIEFGAICATEDSKEGTTAFMEKRKADFKGK